MKNPNRMLIRPAAAAPLPSVPPLVMSLFSAFLPRNARILKAVEKGDAAMLRQAIEDGANVNMMNRRGDSALSHAYGRGHFPLAEILIRSGAEIDERYLSALFLKEAEQGRPGIIRALIERGFSVNLANSRGTSPLLLAALENRTEIVALLLDEGAFVDHQDQNGLTPLMACADRGHSAPTELLLKNGADIRLRDASGFTALQRAEKLGHAQICALIRNSDEKSGQ